MLREYSCPVEKSSLFSTPLGGLMLRLFNAVLLVGLPVLTPIRATEITAKVKPTLTVVYSIVSVSFIFFHRINRQGSLL
jgi:hypothetical protein